MATLDDLEELSTDSDDEEYVPEGGGNVSSEGSVSEGEEERDGKPTRRGVKAKGKAKRQHSRKRKAKARRPRRGLPASTEEGEEEEESDEEECGAAEGGVAKEDTEEKEAKEKARIDNLWASFKQDVATLHKKQPTASSHSKDSSDDLETGPPKKLKIQQTYDFAGEQILVEKEVSADSKEAKNYLKTTTSTSSTKSEPTTESRPPLSPESDNSAIEAKAEALGSEKVGRQALTCSSGRVSSVLTSGAVGKQSLSGPTRGQSSQSGGGLSSVLKSLGKKPKMSTLTKSGLDWEKYKDEHGLHDELVHSNKDGYLARQEFLQWSDQKQFELERNERLKRFKRLH